MLELEGLGPDTPRAITTYNLVVVSHADLRRHVDATELIYFDGYEDWKQVHHEYLFTPDGNDTIDAQMRRVRPFSVSFDV